MPNYAPIGGEAAVVVADFAGGADEALGAGLVPEPHAGLGVLGGREFHRRFFSL